MSQSTPTTESRNVPGQTVNVLKPDSGADITVASAPGGTLQLDFDPATATAGREGNSLVFELDGGGKVTVTDFFVVGDQSLPSLRLPDGTEIASADFFAGSDLDMNTTAGPAAAAPPGSGANYADDPGSLLSGVDKLGMLGTDYWGRSTEPTLEMRGEARVGEVEMPGGSFNFDVSTFFDGVLYSGLFEDGMARKHVGDYTQAFGKLNFNPELSGSTIIDAIRLSGFEAGTRIYFGAPSDYYNGGNYVEIIDPSQVVNFTLVDFINGVYLVAPSYSDVDMTITVSIDIHAASSGVSATVGGSFVIIVDAVADLPVMGEVAFDGSIHGSASSENHNSKFSNGWNRATDKVDAGQNIELAMPLKVTVTFSDVEDNSELHFVLIQVPTSPDGVTWSCEYHGRTYTMADVISVPGKEGFFRIPVDNADIMDAPGWNPAKGIGEITLDVTMKAEGTAEQLGMVGESPDKSIALEVGSWAQEGVTDQELDWTNNEAYAWAEGAVELKIDVVNAELRIKVGWASEGNDPTKAGDWTFDWTEKVSDASSSAHGAPISLHIDGDRGTNPDYISRVEFSFAGERGDLCGNGVVLTTGRYGDYIIEVSTVGDKTVVIITPLDNTTTSIADLNLSFRPETDMSKTAAFDYSDVELSYKVTVENGLGSSVTFSSPADRPLSIVIDAVADMPAVTPITFDDYGSSIYGLREGAEPDQKLTLKTEVRFPDVTGGEEHYILVEKGTEQGFEVHSITINGVEYPLDGANISEVPIDGVLYYQISTPDSVTENYRVEVTVSATPEGDTTYGVNIGGKATVDKATNDGEYDRGNNEAFDLGKVAFTVHPANAGEKDYSATGTYESRDGSFGDIAAGAWNKHGTGTYTVVDKGGSHTYGNVTVSNPGALGDIFFKIDDGGDSPEYITKLTFTLEGDVNDTGALWLGNVHIQEWDGSGTAPSAYYQLVNGDTVVVISTQTPGSLAPVVDLTVKYVPSAWNDVDITIKGYTVDMVNSRSHHEGTIASDVPLLLTVDAVAARPDMTPFNHNNDVHYNGSHGDQSAAKLGEEVKVDFSVKFNDMGDPNEGRFLLLQVNPYAGTGGAYDKLVITAADGSPLGVITDFAKLDVITVNGIRYYQIPVTDIPATGADAGKVSGELTMTTPPNFKPSGVSGDANLTFRVGAMTQDYDSDGVTNTGTSTARNDAGFDIANVTVKIAAVGSTVGVSVVGHAFENAHWNAHQGFLSRAEILALDNAPYTLPGGQTAYGSGLDILKANGAEIAVAFGRQPGESISRAVFVAEYSGNDMIPGGFLYNGVLYNADGTTHPVGGGDPRVTCYEVDGKVVIVIEGFNPAAGLHFIPDQNYSSQDVNLKYAVTVTDGASLQDKVLTNDPSMLSDPDLFPGGFPGSDSYPAGWDKNSNYADGSGPSRIIAVDAVAQKPDFDGDLSIHSGHGEGYADYARPGGDVHVKGKVIFGDVEDGSEGHYLLIEATMTGFKPGSVTFIGSDDTSHTIDLHGGAKGAYTDSAGNSYTISIQSYNGRVYYKIDVSEYVKDFGLDDGIGRYTLDVDIKLGVPGDASGSGKVSIGAMSHEKYEEITKGGDVEIRQDNNTAWLTSGDVEVNFERAGGLSLKAGWVSENDRSTMHIAGADAPADGGTTIAFNLSNGNDAITNFRFTNYDPELGELFITGSDGTGIPVGADGAISDADIAKLISGEYKLHFIPAPNNSDADVNLRFEATLTNSKTGETHNYGSAPGDRPGSTTILVDAVATKPEWAVGFESPNKPDYGTNENGADKDSIARGEKYSLTLSLKFADFDGTEHHYALIEAKPNTVLWYNGQQITTTYTADDGVVYYKVLIPLSLIDHKSGEVTVTLEMQTFAGRPLPGDSDVKFGAMAWDATSGDGEVTFHNNTAIMAGGKLTIDFATHVHGHVVSWTDAYENGTPNAHLGDYTRDGHATISFGTTTAGGDPITGVDLTWDADKGYFIGPDGTEHHGGSATIDLTTGTEGLRFMPHENYKDEDANVTFVARDANGHEVKGEFTIIIDAVAQMPEDLGFGARYPEHDGVQYSAYGENQYSGKEKMTITVNAVFQDTEDGSQHHFIVVEQLPGLSVYDKNGSVCSNVIYKDGKAYILVNVHDLEPGPNGGYLVDVKLGSGYLGNSYYEDGSRNNPDGSYWVENVGPDGKPDGTKSLQLNVGALAVEGDAYGNVYLGGESGRMESNLSNNVGWNIQEKGLELRFSLVETSFGFSVQHTYEGDKNYDDVGKYIDPAHTGKISITVANIGPNESVETLRLEFPADRGHIEYTDGSGNLQSLVNGDLHALILSLNGNDDSIFKNQTALQSMLSSLNLRFVAEGYDSSDISIALKVDVRDSQSGDHKADSAIGGGGRGVIIDAVADMPDVSADTHNHDNPDYPGTVSGGVVNVEIDLSFADFNRSGPLAEQHFAVIGQNAVSKHPLGWECLQAYYYNDSGDKVYVTVTTLFDSAGKPYYGFAISNDMLDSNGSIKVGFAMQAPKVGSSEVYEVMVGGISYEPNLNTGSDKELTLSNNWAENLHKVELKVGGLYTTALSFEFNGDFTEGDANGVAIALSDAARQALANNHDEITSLKLTLNMTGAQGPATIIYDGTAYGVIFTDGKAEVTITDITKSNPFNPDADFRLVWAEVRTDSEGNVVWENDTVGGTPIIDTWNHSGEGSLKLGVEANVTDRFSGQTTGTPLQTTATVDHIPVADAPTDIEGTTPVWDAAGSTLSFIVSAEFADVDGSERHFLLVEARDGWVFDQHELALSGGTWADGDYMEIDGLRYYRIEVSGANPTLHISLVFKVPVGEHTDPLKLGGYSVEKARPDAPSDLTVGQNVGLPDGGFTVIADLVFVQGAAPIITEGDGYISLDAKLRNSDGTPLSSAEALTVTFVLDATGPIDLNAVNNLEGLSIRYDIAAGGWLVTMTLPAGESSFHIGIPTIDIEGFQGDRTVSITNVEIAGGSVHITASDPGFTYTVQDPTSFHLAGEGIFDGSDSHYGLEIYAGDGGSHITGSGHDDTIFAGQGDDILHGGKGNDIFAWEADRLGGADTIMDFDFNYQWNGNKLNAIVGMDNDKIQLNFHDLLGDDSGSLETLLRGLTDLGGNKFGTDGGFTVEFTAANQLHITFAGDGGQGTVQAITVNSGNEFVADISSVSLTEAQAVLQQILISNS